MMIAMLVVDTNQKENDRTDNLVTKDTDIKKEKPEYLILGGGIIGFAVAKSLKKKNKKITIIDQDKIRVETLRQEGFNALIGDCTSKDIFNIVDFKDIISISILNSDDDTNIKTIENFRSILGMKTVITSRARDTLKKEEMIKVGATFVFVTPNIVSNSIVEYLELMETKHTGNKLALCLEENKGQKIAIILHDNPDPDAISSGFALKEIAKKYGISCDILYDGKIGHHENKAFVNLLDIQMIKITSIDDYYKYDKIAMVDCSCPSVNNSVPDDVSISIIIDHHPRGEHEINAEFIDIRTNVGASATILTKYLQQLDVQVSKELAAALLYGIRTDTNDFRRNTTSEDFAAATFLHPLSDHDLLTQVETPAMSVETLDILGDAIRNRKVAGTCLISNVGFIRDRDSLPQAADYLLTMEGIYTTMIYGILDNNIFISARNDDIRIHIGDIMRQAFGENAGGHSTAAGAKISLGVFSSVKDKNTLLKLVEESITRNFLNAVGIEEEDF